MKESVTQESLSRLSCVYRVSIEKLTPNITFGKDLRSRSISDWTENEADKILVDIQEMQGGIGETRIGNREIETVSDFCALAQEYYAANPTGYRRLVARWYKEKTMPEKPLWRRILYRATGW